MITTENLIIRKASFADCDDFARWESRENVIQHFCIDGKRDLDAVIDQFHKVTHDNSRMWLTILDKKTRNAIGRVGITSIDEINDSMDLTIIYIADESMRGKGLGSEAIEAVLELAFTRFGMHRVSLDYFLDDDIGAHLYSKLGFRKEGIMVRAGKQNEQYYDLQLMAILKEEWEALHPEKAGKTVENVSPQPIDY